MIKGRQVYLCALEREDLPFLMDWRNQEEFRNGFQELGLEKIWSELYEFDRKKITLYQELGMQVDGTLRNQYFYDGKWWDSKILSILSEEWRRRSENGD